MVLLEEEQLERTFFKTLFVFPDQSDSEVPHAHRISHPILQEKKKQMLGGSFSLTCFNGGGDFTEREKK
uniref:Uncharacterized protein n=1 Tax=Nelumbo nucifera TaxID=4432 RepID=A0A822YKC2_NELNU|nr:TPA_asm: hypothetical protein HUJ06_011813 [Nelumbo nucifera]